MTYFSGPLVTLGEHSSHSFVRDPKHLGFVFARYKFVAKMLHGYDRVLEVGCGDCTASPIVAHEVGDWVGIDNASLGANMGIKHDIVTDGPFRDNGPDFDAVYALDVLEHIKVGDEDMFFDNIIETIDSCGTVIIGSPSLESQPYASPESKKYHVNCKTEEQFRETLYRHFHRVFLFGMNDETLHTGYGAMCHYRLAICTV